MIKSTNELSDKYEYTITCDKYKTEEVREIKKYPGMGVSLSNIDSALGEKAKAEFMKYLDDNKLKNGCWCKHIKDFL